MPHFKQFRVLAASLAVTGLLSACGSSSNDSVDAPADPNPSPAAVSAFSTAFANGLASLNAYAGLTSAAVADLFDASYLDGGLSKADVMAALQSEAQASAISPDFPSFAQVTVSGITISNCIAATQVCTLSGTLTNNDADTTSVTFTTQVKLSDKPRLFGDQAKS
jgi:hypothetical protein